MEEQEGEELTRWIFYEDLLLCLWDGMGAVYGLACDASSLCALHTMAATPNGQRG
jgi:hypothetical protein